MQKIYDIKHPQKEQEKKKKLDNKQKRGYTFWTGLIVALIFILGGVYFFIFHVEVKIYPETTGVELEKTFTIDAGEDFSSNGTLKGTVFETGFFEEYKEFKATGIEDSATKAEGAVILENKFWESNTPLLKGTRFKTEDGKVFKSKDGVVIPKVSYEGGQLIPGKIEIEVEAAEPGSDYNIESAEFTIPGLKGSPSYNKVAAYSEERMIGGAIGERTVITEEDIEEARNQILNSLLKEGMSVLRKEKIDEYILEEDNQFHYIIQDEEISGKPGEAKNSFSIKIRAKINSLTFTKEDFNKILKDRLIDNAEIEINDNLISNKKVYEESISYNYELDNIEWKKGNADLKVEFAGEVFAVLDNSRLLEQASGSDRYEFEESLKNKSFIKDAKVKFSPFGIGSIPENKERIKSSLIF